MTRHFRFAAIAMAALLAVPLLHADVKTREKNLVKFEGILGGFANMFGGAAAKDGITSTVAVKGDRMSRINDHTGQIIDLAEQKIYNLDMKKKTYTAVTFAEMRAQMEKARADAEKRAKDMKPEEKQQMEEAGRQLEFDYDLHQTGQHKNLLGHDTNEVVMTVTAHEKGLKIEESGGFVMTTTMWMGPKIAALDEIMDFQLRFFKAVYGESLVMDVQQMAGMLAMYPSFKTMAEKMQAESGKMRGTPLSTTTVFESVKSAEQMKETSQQSSSSGGGSGIGGLLARRMMRGRGQAEQRTTTFTTQTDRLSVDTAVSAEDVAIPAGFKEKK
jgi:hypothetical protein